MEWIKPGSPELLCAALLLGLTLDLVYPEHRGLALRLHPVVVTFHAARRMAPPGSSTLRGALASVATIVAILAPASALLYIAWTLGPVAWVIVAGVIVKLSIPVRLLLETVADTARRLREGDLDGARRRVGGIVRRRVEDLGPGHVASAAIESLSESLVDGVTSPLLWYVAAGPLGALLQRTVNTLDGALGFKTPEYLRAGMVPARLDTLMNLAPARLTALATVLLAPLAGLSARGALRAWLRYRRATESLNAGHIMSAYAGALGVALEKRGSYRLGWGGLPGHLHVSLALRLTVAVLAASYLASCLAIEVLYR